MKRASSDAGQCQTQTQPTKSGLSVADVGSLVRALLSANEKFRLEMFTDGELAEGLRLFVNQADNDAIKSAVAGVVSRTQSHLCVRQCAEEGITAEVTRFLGTRKRAAEAEENGDGMSCFMPCCCGI